MELRNQICVMNMMFPKMDNYFLTSIFATFRQRLYVKQTMQDSDLTKTADPCKARSM